MLLQHIILNVIFTFLKKNKSYIQSISFESCKEICVNFILYCFKISPYFLYLRTYFLKNIIKTSTIADILCISIFEFT